MGVHSFWAPPRSGGSGFNGLARPARVSENPPLYLLPRTAACFSGAELAQSLITSSCCREGLLHQELYSCCFSPHLHQRSVPTCWVCGTSQTLDEDEECAPSPKKVFLLISSTFYIIRICYSVKQTK